MGKSFSKGEKDACCQGAVPTACYRTNSHWEKTGYCQASSSLRKKLLIRIWIDVAIFEISDHQCKTNPQNLFFGVKFELEIKMTDELHNKLIHH